MYFTLFIFYLYSLSFFFFRQQKSKSRKKNKASLVKLMKAKRLFFELKFPPTGTIGIIK